MKKQIRKIIALVMLGMAVVGSAVAAEKIDRHKVVTRHNPHVTTLDSLSSLTVGNGRFAFTVDATGLQTFPRDYSKGVPLGTMSEWGWHSFPNTEGFQAKDALANHDFHRGHPEYYSLQIKQPERTRKSVDYLRANPHRLHLGTIGLDIANASKIKDINQNLDLWTGKIDSKFEYAGMRYHVETVCAPDEDCIASNISLEGKASDKKFDGNVRVAFCFAYPSGGHCDDACKWDAADNLHKTTLKAGKNSAEITRKLDDTTYYIYVTWKGNADIKQTAQHRIVLKAKGKSLSFSALFQEDYNISALSGKSVENAKSPANPDFASCAKASANRWSAYWNEGGFIDLGNVKDKKAAELERRIILSQYLMGAQEAGNIPPQETGLTYNSWFGKFHLEMTWWHLVHYGLWNKPELLDRQLSWYASAEEKARVIAERQGFKGVRWMKMTDPSAEEAPSNVGSFLIWQQPHLTYMAELLYRAAKSDVERAKVLEKYGKLVDETTLFMTDFAEYDAPRDRYILRGCIPAQETLKADSTINPPFELSYWLTALDMSQKWRTRRGLAPMEDTQKVMDKLSPLAFNKDSLYLAAESAVNTYSDIRMTSDHPALLGALGMMPDNRLLDKAVMAKTLRWIWDNWNWDKTWGWDYPMTAMTCARLGEADMAVDALLMPKRTNTYLVSGHNYQDQRLRLYMPGNGGLLTAVAMMCAGWDGCDSPNPGFPKDWDVKWEGLLPMP
ncbi:MAG: hypothetical protein SOZ58_04980 [Prevotella sp.]|nr:hypothetical protein [Prevotella sp.]